MRRLRPFIGASCVALAFFLPALLGRRVLAIGDGLNEALPGFLASYARWQPDMFGGFPIYADPSKAFWYPLRLLHVLPSGFNAYVILAYVIAGAATYAYVRNVSGSVAAGVASAFAFASGGFLVSHFGQPMIAEPACWFCVAVWSLDSYLRSRRGRYLIALSGALLLALTAGQPQVAAFAIPLVLGYLLFVGFERRSLRATIVVYVEGALAIVLGVSGAALAWFPTIALSTESVRSGLDFGSYVLYSVIPGHLALMLIYPFSGGGGAASVYHGPIAAGIDFVEMANYVPLAALVLAPLASFSGRRRVALYWTAIACIGLLLSVGDATPLAALTYRHLPGFNLFRIPGRHAFEFTFAVAVLSGLGVAAIARGLPRIALGGTLLFGLAVVALASVDVAAQDPNFLHEPSVTIFLAAIAVQVGLVCASAMFGIVSGWRPALACCAVVVGAAVFGLTAYWRDSPPAMVLQTPAYAKLLRQLPLAVGQRVYTEGHDTEPELRPNLPLIWGVPEAGGYTPLQFATSSIYLQTGEDGRFLNVGSPLVDAAAVRYFVTPAQAEPALNINARFGPADMDSYLSAGRPNAPRSLTFGLREPRSATRIALVTALGASVAVKQGTAVVMVVVRGRSGATQKLQLRAGVETAELAYDRPDVIAAVQHRKADVYERAGALDWYVCLLPIHFKEPVASVTFTVVDSGIAFNIRKISLLDDGSAQAYPFSAETKYFGDVAHFRYITGIAGASVFENLRSAPAVWIARAIPLPSEPSGDDALAANRESLMRMDLRRNATVSGDRATSDAAGQAVVRDDAPERRDVTTTCRNECLLASSMTYSHDWTVSVDGRRAELLRTDGFLQGVIVPAGRHDVRFAYEPAPGKFGLFVSGASIAILVAFAWWRRERSRTPTLGSS
jgi:hypothetical protein